MMEETVLLTGTLIHCWAPTDLDTSGYETVCAKNSGAEAVIHSSSDRIDFAAGRQYTSLLKIAIATSLAWIF